MFSHVFLGITDFERALAFYRALMHCLGIEERFCDPTRPWEPIPDLQGRGRQTPRVLSYAGVARMADICRSAVPRSSLRVRLTHL